MKADDRIHIMHLIGSTGLYGAERWILALMRAMDTQRFRSTLVNLVDSSLERSAVVQAADDRGLEAFDFLAKGRFNPFSSLRLSRWAREQRVDIIHGHGFKSDLVGLLNAKFSGCRVMTTPHGWSLEADLKLQMYEALDRFSFRFMDMVCPLSPHLADGLIGGVNKQKLRLIDNGVDVDEIHKAVPVERRYHDSYTIGYIGQLIERKDIPTLLSAFQILGIDRENTRLMIVGDGAERVELQDECEKLGISARVDFLGYRKDAPSWLKTFDLFVLPSRLEGIPRCIMEALSAAIPVVVTDIPGNRELISHMETGLMYPTGDSKRLAVCMAFMMDNPKKARDMAKRGCMKVTESYSNRKMAKEYANVYEELML